tara:strand:+ start:3977 stop:5056 length:1080 start_codon:yes stop_codon:yes gene_type:complete
MIYDNLIINDSIWTKLRNMQNANTIPHAILFHGSNGSGKEGHAIEFASMLNYKTNADLEKIKIFQHPNIHLITPIIKDKTINKKSNALSAMSEKSLEEYILMKKDKMLHPYKKISFKKKSTILINSIRDIKKNIHLNDGRLNIYMIFEADKLCFPRNEAGNALLKVLEEPPSQTIFILVTSKKENMLDTIVSRCCDFYFQKIPAEKISNYIEKNNYQIEEKDLLIRLCNNDIGLILKMIDQKIDLVTIINKSKIFISDVINQSNNQRHSYELENLFKRDKHEFIFFIKISIIILNDLYNIIHHIDKLLILKNNLKVKDLNYLNCINILEDYYKKLESNLNPSIGMFAMIIDMKKALNKK